LEQLSGKQDNNVDANKICLEEKAFYELVEQKNTIIGIY